MLYLVATPIGNLGDISYRAIQTLQSVDVIACEDTLHSLKLLNHYEIKKPLISCHKFNEKESAEKIVALLQEGKNVALISDAGMPIISDPGSILVNLCQQNNLQYTVVPGANAGLCALLLSGFDSTSFAFFGFLPKENAKRKEQSQKYVDIQSTLIFYTPPHGLKTDLKFLYSVLGERKFCLVKEITKIYENCFFGVLGQENFEDIKGEYVIIIEGAAEKPNDLCSLSVQEHFDFYQKQGLSKMDATKAVSKDRKVAKSLIYNSLNDDKD